MLQRIHWSHLALLAGLSAWLPLTDGLAAELRLAGWLVVAFATLALAERIAPYRADWRPGAPELRRDGTVASLNVATDALVGIALAAAAAHFVDGRSTWPLWAQIVGGLAVGELFAYALHRASHADNWLWRVHLLHHRPGQLNVANALTAHPVNAAYDKLAHLAPMLALGLSDEAIVAVTLFTLTQGLVAHANVAGTIGPLNLVVGSAELHRLHHSTDEAQAGNFGTNVPWWDLVFGTFRWRAAPHTVGVFEPARYPGEHAVRALLAYPFVRFHARH